MKRILCVVLAVCGLCLAFTSEAKALGRRSGGNMMTCNAQVTKAPVQANRADATQTASARVLNPVAVVAPVEVAKSRSGLSFDALATLGNAPEVGVNAVQVAAK